MNIFNKVVSPEVARQDGRSQFYFSPIGPGQFSSPSLVQVQVPTSTNGINDHNVDLETLKQRLREVRNTQDILFEQQLLHHYSLRGSTFNLNNFHSQLFASYYENILKARSLLVPLNDGNKRPNQPTVYNSWKDDEIFTYRLRALHCLLEDDLKTSSGLFDARWVSFINSNEQFWKPKTNAVIESNWHNGTAVELQQLQPESTPRFGVSSLYSPIHQEYLQFSPVAPVQQNITNSYMSIITGNTATQCRSNVYGDDDLLDNFSAFSGLISRNGTPASLASEPSIQSGHRSSPDNSSGEQTLRKQTTLPMSETTDFTSRNPQVELANNSQTPVRDSSVNAGTRKRSRLETAENLEKGSNMDKHFKANETGTATTNINIKGNTKVGTIRFTAGAQNI